MDARKIDLLMEIVRLGSFNKAADLLGYSHSGLIHIINTMDEEAGFPLLERNYNGVVLSETAKGLEPYFQNLLEADKELTRRMEQARRAMSGTEIRIGSQPSIASFLLPELLNGFMDDHPDIKVEIRVSGNELPEKVYNGEIQVGFAAYENIGKCEWFPIMSDPYYAVIPKAMKPKKRLSIRLEELVKGGLMIPVANERNAVVTKLKEMGISNDLITVSSLDGHVLMSMVKQGMGVTLLPGLFRENCPEDLCMIPTDPPITRQLGMIAQSFKKLDPSAKSFVAHVKRVVMEREGIE